MFFGRATFLHVLDGDPLLQHQGRCLALDAGQDLLFQWCDLRRLECVGFELKVAAVVFAIKLVADVHVMHERDAGLAAVATRGVDVTFALRDERTREGLGSRRRFREGIGVKPGEGTVEGQQSSGALYPRELNRGFGRPHDVKLLVNELCRNSNSYV